MRYPRMLTMLVLVLAAGVALATLLTGRATSHPVRAAAATTPPGLRRALDQEVRLLTRRPAVQAPVLSVDQSGGPCFVASGACSLTPCVIPVQSTSNLALGSGRACPLGDRVPMGLRVKLP